MKYYYQVYCLPNIFSITVIIKLAIITQLSHINHTKWLL